MDSLIFFFREYKKAGFLRLFRDAYVTSGRINWPLGAYSIVSFILLIYLSFQERDPFFWIGIVFIVLWAVFLWRAVNNCYSHLTRGNEERLRMYHNERQYLRYLIFRDNVTNNNSCNGISVEDALNYLNVELTTESANPISSSYYIALIVTLIGALIGSFSSKWSLPTIVIVLFLSMLVLFTSMAIIGTVRGRKAKLLELKRFLLWLQNDQQL